MKERIFIPLLSMLIAVGFAFAEPNCAPVSQAHSSPQGKIVIANRASGTISVIDAHSDTLIGTFALPAGPNAPEPMYVVHSRKRVFVGDRANSRVAVFDSRSFAVEGTIPAGAGVFHMWGDPLDRQLWVNNDIDKTATVIDPITLEVLAS